MKQNKTIVLGITGNSGSGKSKAASVLAKFGAKIIDADKIARNILSPKEAAYSQVVELFGESILNSDNTINRSIIADKIFSDSKFKLKHEAITHKYIKREMLSELEHLKALNPVLVVIDAPLLIECGFVKHCDVIWLVTAERNDKINRIMQRDSLSKEDAIKRLDAQTDESKLICYAQAVFQNKSLNRFCSDIEKAYFELLNTEFYADLKD